MPLALSEVRSGSPGIETNPGEGTWQDGGGSLRPLGHSQTATSIPTQNEDDSRSSDEQGDQLSRFSSLEDNLTSGEDVKGINHPAMPSTLPQPPTDRLEREEIVKEIVDLAGQVVSIALFASVDTEMSSLALSLLHHDRTQAKFGQNRYSMRCDDLEGSLETFLLRISDTIQIGVPQLRSHLRSSPPLMLLLEGVDSILNPLNPQYQEISATIEEFGNYENVCLVTTSRMRPEVRGFHRVDVTTISEDDARETFYILCNLPKSSAVDSLIARLDFHPLTIELLACCVRENDWDELTLLQVLGDDQTGALKTSDYQRLMDAMDPVLRPLTVNELGTSVLDMLEAIAASPCGVEERELEKETAGIGELVDALCKFSLVYRQDGAVKIFAPARSYFQKPASEPAQREEVVGWDVDPVPGACKSPSFHPFHSRVVTHFEGLPTYDGGSTSFGLPRIIPRLRAPPGWNWVRGLSGSMTRSNNNVFFCSLHRFRMMADFLDYRDLNPPRSLDNTDLLRGRTRAHAHATCCP